MISIGGATMARINVEDDFWIVVGQLTGLLGDEDRAIGQALRFKRLAQERYKRKRIITKLEFERLKFAPELIGVIAQEVDGGYQAIDSHLEFGWLLNRVENGRKGGVESALSRWGWREPLTPEDDEARKKAHSMATTAIRAGYLKPKPCEHCGVTKVDAHHPDYSRPLDVVWLCRSCHMKLHYNDSDNLGVSKSQPKLTNDNPLPLPLTLPLSHSLKKRESSSGELRPFLHRLIQIWNQECGILPKVKHSNASRDKRVAKLWRERSPEEWSEVIKRIAISEFCLGKNDRGWKATFDWLLQPETWLKITEGKYDNRLATATGVSTDKWIELAEEFDRALNRVGRVNTRSNQEFMEILGERKHQVLYHVGVTRLRDIPPGRYRIQSMAKLLKIGAEEIGISF